MNARPDALKNAPFNGLQWVRGELEQSIARARSLIEQQAERGGDPLPLQQAFVEMHQVRGTAAMIRCFGAAALASEMTASLNDLLGARARQADMLYGALLGACLQLTDYVQALSEDMDDCVLVLQPAINELRLARGQPVLTEVELFSQQLLGLELTLPLPPPDGAEPGALQLQLRRYSQPFQASLLSWIRNAPDAQTAAARIGKITEQLAGYAQRVETHQLLRVATAAIEALLGRGLENSLELKRLFGRIDQQLKQLIEHGEDNVAPVALDLSQQLLFLIGRSNAQGPRVQALRQHFHLAAYLPQPDELERRRRCIHGPNTALLATLASEIRADFTRVKDQIDLAVRAGGVSSDDFQTTRRGLQRISDVLGGLGLAVPQQQVGNQARALEQLGPHALPAQWLALAESILRVESDLDAILFRHLRPGDPAVDQDSLPAPMSRDLAESVAALYRESLVNLARVKTVIDGFLRNGGTSDLPDAVLLIDEVAAGCEILGHSRGAEAVGRLQRFVAGTRFAKMREHRELADRFAEAVAEVEYFLEMARDAAPTADAQLDRVEARLDAIDAAAEVAEAAAPVEVATAPAPAPATEAPAPETAAGDDAEIRDVFLDEAAEVLSLLRSEVPMWTRDPRDTERLTTIRRAFHTLKGSGRMVGAAQIGAYAWAIERMLNRCLDGSIAINPGIVALTNTAVEQLPSLIAAFRDDGHSVEDVRGLIERAQAYADGRDPEQASSAVDMAAIFRSDAREKLGEVRRWLAQLDPALHHHSVDPEPGRAFHTLRGAARIVEASAISELSAALERWLDRLLAANEPLDDAGLELLDAATDTLMTWCAEVGTPAVAQQNAQLWLQQIESLQGSVAALQEDEEARRLADIFAGEALDLVQRAETLLSSWEQSPDDRTALGELRTVLHTLAGAAQMAACAPIGNAAQALQRRIEQAVNEAVVPSATAFAHLRAACEAVFQQLDSFRDGRLRGDGGELVAQIEAIAWDAQAPQVEIDETSAEPAIEAPAPPSFEAAAPVETPNPVFEMPVEPSAPPTSLGFETPVPESAAPDAEPYSESFFDASLLDSLPPAAPGAPSVATAAAAPLTADVPLSPPAPETRVEPQGEVAGSATPAHDPELLAIFIGEAEELTDVYESGVVALEKQPRDRAVIDGLMRVLHTLKGSARVTGLNVIGDDAHALESLLEGCAGDAGSLLPPLRAAVDRLRGQIEALQRGVSQAAVAESVVPPVPWTPASPPTVAAPEAMPGLPTEAMSVPEPAPFEFAPSEVQPVEPAPPAPDLAAPVAGGVEAAPTAEFAPPAPEPFSDRHADAAAADILATDRELLEIFGLEAAELAEQLEQAYARWKVRPAQQGPAQDLQRTLHTLKGAARTAGATVMGDAAHELETRIAALSASGVSSAEHLTPIGEGIAGLRRLVDRIERGDWQAVFAPVVSPVVATLPTPAAVTTAMPAAASGLWDPELFWRPADEDDARGALQRETARVPVETLETLLNEAGEVSINRARIEEQHTGMQTQLGELAQVVARIREQLRQLDIETDAQIAARGRTEIGGGSDRYGSEFDPLEMDRYTRMQELSRALAESAGDLGVIHGSLDGLGQQAVTLLQQQARVNTVVQQGLMRTLMVPFARQTARLQRVATQTALDTGKQVEVRFSGAEAELDRNVLERMTAPLEHLIRNAVVHGIESPAQRRERGKPERGLIDIRLWREGTQLRVELRDDGNGLDFDSIRATAVRRGLVPADAPPLSDELAAQYIFMPGFSTARELTQAAGRGVGMDVVAAEVKQLGGTLELASEAGTGTRFLIRLPLNLAMAQALLVETGGEIYAVPLPSVEGIVRLPREQFAGAASTYRYGEIDYRLCALGDFIGAPPMSDSDARMLYAMLVRLPEGLGGGDRRYALVAERLIGNREIVSKPVGPQISGVPGVTGATILADGRAVLILDPATLIQDQARRELRARASADVPRAPVVVRPTVMVVDDSLTIRRVTERLLQRHGYAVVTARDGLDAMAQLQTETPAAILLDIEMPRADGFEVAAYVRNTPRLAQVPIIMITSRSGDKHRERAATLGVNGYLIKPYQEDQLLHDLAAVTRPA